MKKRGIGVGCMFYGIGYGFSRQDIAGATIEICEDGSVIVRSGEVDEHSSLRAVRPGSSYPSATVAFRFDPYHRVSRRGPGGLAPLLRAQGDEEGARFHLQRAKSTTDAA